MTSEDLGLEFTLAKNLELIIKKTAFFVDRLFVFGIIIAAEIERHQIELRQNYQMLQNSPGDRCKEKGFKSLYSTKLPEEYYSHSTFMLQEPCFTVLWNIYRFFSAARFHTGNIVK